MGGHSDRSLLGHYLGLVPKKGFQPQVHLAAQTLLYTYLHSHPHLPIYLEQGRTYQGLDTTTLWYL